MTQNKEIKQHLVKGGKITSLEAVNLFGCIRLASRIHDLRNEGLLIKDEWIERNGKRFKQYYL